MQSSSCLVFYVKEFLYDSVDSVFVHLS